MGLHSGIAPEFVYIRLFLGILYMNIISMSQYHKKKTWEEEREERVEIFLDTIRIVNEGRYITESGRYVELPVTAWMQEGTTVYSRPFSVNGVAAVEGGTKTYVVEGDCLKTSRELSERGLNPAVLNMANRQHPGGGVLHGARAQEESIFRRSNIFRSLYQYFPGATSFGVEQKGRAYPLDRNFGGIYTPDVTVFRNTEHTRCRLMEDPFRTSVITVAAMNRPELTDGMRIADHLIDGVKNKIRTILRIGLKHGHDSLVLGAWGCGAFCNPPEHMAELFKETLEEPEFKGKYREVVFSIIDDHNARRPHNPEGNLLPFVRVFGTLH